MACLENVLEICWDSFPWICNQAISLGRRRRETRLCKLGTELFILTQDILFTNETRANSQLIKIAELVNKASSGRKEASFDTLRQIVDIHELPHTNGVKSFVSDIHDALLHFVRKDPGFSLLLQLIADGLQTTDSEETLPAEQSNLRDNSPGYPTHVNNTLYTQLEHYSVCACSTGHLRWARLRLDPEHDKQEEKDVLFELLFVASSATKLESRRSAAIRWKEARVSVARHQESKGKKRVGFAIQGSDQTCTLDNARTLSDRLRHVRPGEFCKLIKGQPNTRIHFHIQNSRMRVSESAPTTKPRNILPCDGTPLSEWLEQTNYISKRVKIIVAYTVARSVWQYYNSYWMVTPWTHDNIQFLQERRSTVDHVQPHVFFITKFQDSKGDPQDVCEADDLIHMYPNILALAVVLIEIATGKPFKPDNTPYLWDETTLNDYYEWAYTAAKSGDLKRTVGAAYEGVVNSCLDDELFRDESISPSNEAERLESRRSRLFETVVAPLEELYHAYRDDWGLQELPPADTSAMISDLIRSERDSVLRPASRDQFTIAVFCALPIEADAVTELFDDIWAERKYGKASGDDNAYTLGRIGRHNVVLAHMAGMGKNAACQAASCARSSYPGIRMALVVGICGGVPSGDGHADLILGDVVISDGIVQYDLGRQYPDTFTARAGHEVCRQPSREIQSTLSKLKSTRGRAILQSRVSENLRTLYRRLGPLRTRYPGADRDELFRADYRHKHQADSTQYKQCRTCDAAADAVCEEAQVLSCKHLGCDPQFLAKRRRLEQAMGSNQAPPLNVHFGLVGSGDTVMKSGRHRDATAQHHNLIAFEMEASGVCDIFPTLVIKGVCDYADSHKNKSWQNYAAVTAAACMKAYLEEWVG